MKRRNFLAGLATTPALLQFDLVSAFQTRTTGSKRWTIGSEQVSLELEDLNGTIVVNALRNRATNFEWSKRGSSGFAFGSDALSFEGLGPGSGFVFSGQKAERLSSGASQLQLSYTNSGASLKLTLLLTSFPETSVVELQCRVENTGANAFAGVNRFDPLVLRLKPLESRLQVHAIRRSHYATEQLPIGESLEVRGGGWNAPAHAGFVCLEETSAREFLFVGVEWERDWVVRFKNDGDGILLTAGLIDIKHDLKPGAALESPRIFLGVTRGELDDAARAKDDYLRKYVAPVKLDRFPWVVYDIWGTEKENVEQMILDELDFSAALGVEHLYVDASWYEGSSKLGTGDWGAGLGRYREDKEKYPRGLAYISEQAHKKNMTFGLWVDPVVVDQRLVPKEIPHNWVGQKGGKDNVLTIKAWEAPAVHICMGCPEVVEHVKANLTRIISEFKLDWLKWDNSGLPGMPVVCDREDHGHQKGDGSYAAQRGLYSVWAYLREKHPNVVFEQCGYGSRHDLGLARYCRANWLSDATTPSSHVRDNAFIASYLYPSFYNGSWIVLDQEVQKQKDPEVLDAMYRSRMLGLFGFGTLNGKLLTERVSLFPAEVLAAARRNIPLYKEYRHLLSENCFHLTPADRSENGWQAVEFCKRDAREMVAIIFRGASTQERMRLKLKGLAPEGRYRVWSDRSPEGVVKSGAELMQSGLIVTLVKADTSVVFRAQLQS